MKSLYTVIFKDNSNFSGGNFTETKWTEIPNKPIKRILYTLPTGDNLVLNNYDKFFHMIEATYDLSGKNKGKSTLEYSYIMGKRNKIVICYKINLKTGNMERKIFDEEDNFVKKLNKNGWK